MVTGGYAGGIIVALVSTLSSAYAPFAGYAIQPTNQPAFGALGNIVPCDRKGANTIGNIPFATLLNNGGEFAGAIGPSGSKKAPVVRAMWQGMVDNQAYGGTNILAGVLGQYLYCGTSASSTAGKYVFAADKDGADTIPVGICTHVPTSGEPWLGVASLL